jgi:hypothetical protein
MFPNSEFAFIGMRNSVRDSKSVREGGKCSS